MQQIFFPGQQSDERVLYTVRPHIYALYMNLAKVGLLTLLLFVFAPFLGQIHQGVAFIEVVLALCVGGIGALVSVTVYGKQVAYITDRRIIRFEATTPFAVNTRSLSWDEVVKIKTFPRNMFLKMFSIGTVTIHAGSTYVHTDANRRENTVTNDDLDLEYVYYYQDLGNYLEKILYAYKHDRSSLETIRPFVAKPAGQRYR